METNRKPVRVDARTGQRPNNMRWTIHGAVLARRWRVSLAGDRVDLALELDGERVQGARELRRKLFRKLQTQQMTDLRSRQSTNLRKDGAPGHQARAPRGGIGWGVLSDIRRNHWKIMMGYLRPGTKFSDSEIKSWYKPKRPVG